MIPYLEPDTRTRAAIEEVQATISAAYPNAVFELVRAVDEPGAYDLLVAVPGADPDEVGDLVVERVVEMRVEESIPIHVVPLDRSQEAVDSTEAETRRAG